MMPGGDTKWDDKLIRKNFGLFTFFIVFVFFAPGANAEIPNPHGISGTVLMSDGITQASEGTHFSVKDTASGDIIEGTTGGPPGKSGRYSVVVSGGDGDEVIIIAWNQIYYGNKTISLSGDMTGIDVVMNMNIKDFSDTASKEPATHNSIESSADKKGTSTRPVETNTQTSATKENAGFELILAIGTLVLHRYFRKR